MATNLFRRAVETFKQPKNREDSSDVNKNFDGIGRNAKNFHLQKFSVPLGFETKVRREGIPSQWFEYLSLYNSAIAGSVAGSPRQ